MTIGLRCLMRAFLWEDQSFHSSMGIAQVSCSCGALILHLYVLSLLAELRTYAEIPAGSLRSPAASNSRRSAAPEKRRRAKIARTLGGLSLGEEITISLYSPRHFRYIFKRYRPLSESG